MKFQELHHDDTILQELGRRLARLRIDGNLTQAELARLAKVSRQTINAMELNKYVPSTVLALRMASIFETEVDKIFSLEDSDWE